MRPLVPALILTALVAACGTPQEQCISRNTRDLQVVDRLITESRATINRGYALEEIQTFDTEWRQCGWYPPAGKDKPPRPRMCMIDVPTTTTRPKAVNLNEERAKLASMEAKRRDLDRAAVPYIAACKAAYPE